MELIEWEVNKEITTIEEMIKRLSRTMEVAGILSQLINNSSNNRSNREVLRLILGRVLGWDEMF